jgi:hypothetical protein
LWSCPRFPGTGLGGHKSRGTRGCPVFGRPPFSGRPPTVVTRGAGTVLGTHKGSPYEPPLGRHTRRTYRSGHQRGVLLRFVPRYHAPSSSITGIARLGLYRSIAHINGFRQMYSRIFFALIANDLLVKIPLPESSPEPRPSGFPYSANILIHRDGFECPHDLAERRDTLVGALFASAPVFG